MYTFKIGETVAIKVQVILAVRNPQKKKKNI